MLQGEYATETTFGDALCSRVDLLSALNSLTSLLSTQPHWFEDPFKVMHRQADQLSFFKVRVFIKIDRLTGRYFEATDLTFIKRQHSTCQWGPFPLINIVWNWYSAKTQSQPKFQWANRKEKSQRQELTLDRETSGPSLDWSLFWTQDGACCF